MSTKTEDPKTTSIGPSLGIERAIETVRLFSKPDGQKNLPSLEQFALQDGKLRLQDRSRLKTTFAFTKDFMLSAFSSVLRTAKEQKHRAIKGTLQQSLDLLKVYSAALEHMQKGTEDERSLAERVLMAAHTYNELVRQAKDTHSLSSAIKQFFLKIAGWAVDDELIQSEIQIPKTVKISSEMSEVKRQSTDKKVLKLLHAVKPYSEVEPKPQEKDLFLNKANSLLQSNGYTLQESLRLTSQAIIDASLQDGILLLRLVISDFPGTLVEIKGTFQRDIFNLDLALPIKDSFQLYYYNYPSGFPHPLQYTGIALSEKLLPHCCLRPHLCPKLEELFEIKQKIVKGLTDSSTYYARAKALLRERKRLFEETPLLKELLMQSIIAIISQQEVVESYFEEITKKPHWFEELSYTHARIIEQVMQKPCDKLQEEWLLKLNPEISQVEPERACTRCREIMHEVIDKACNDFPDAYSKILGEVLGKAAASIQLLQLSEHFNFAPPPLSEFEKKILACLYRQQLIFAYELQELEGKDLKQHLTQVLLDDIALFQTNAQTKASMALVDELIHYYTLRYEAT